jgi:hypothetical protein
MGLPKGIAITPNVQIKTRVINTPRFDIVRLIYIKALPTRKRFLLGKKRCSYGRFILFSHNTLLIHSRNDSNLHHIFWPFHLP